MKKNLVYLVGLLFLTASCMPYLLKSIQSEHSYEKIREKGEETSLDSARFELGRALFYDPILSNDSTVSCSSCHHQSFAFADNKKVSPGVQGRLAKRNAPSLANVGSYQHFLFDASVPTLEMQLLVPIQEHEEMDDNIVEVGKRLERVRYYQKLAQRAFQQNPNPFVITRAIAYFERQLISENSRFDQFLRGQTQLSSQEKKGMRLFFEELNCDACHSGRLFTNQETMNNGLSTSDFDPGRYRLTHQDSDFGLFKVPSLRNIALTAPYMHDGRFGTLDEVLNHYQKGGEKAPNKSPLIQPLKMSQVDQEALKSFLFTLTDSTFLTNKKIGPPPAR